MRRAFTTPGIARAAARTPWRAHFLLVRHCVTVSLCRPLTTLCAQVAPAVLRPSVENAVRAFASDSDDLRKRIGEFQDLFVAAREDIEFAQDAQGTTYFNEEAEVARDSVDEAVAVFEQIKDSLDEKARVDFEQGNGLKVEQLIQELEIVMDADDH